MRNVVNDGGEALADSVSQHGPDLDLAFLDAQTFGDHDLEAQVLGLFVEQARRVVPSLPGLPATGQADAAHLLKGSARGIGAWAAAAVAEAYETALPDARPAIHANLAATFARAAHAIAIRLAAIGG